MRSGNPSVLRLCLICYRGAYAKGRLSRLSLGDLSWVSPDLLDSKANWQFLYRVNSHPLDALPTALVMLGQLLCLYRVNSSFTLIPPATEGQSQDSLLTWRYGLLFIINRKNRSHPFTR